MRAAAPPTPPPLPPGDGAGGSPAVYDFWEVGGRYAAKFPYAVGTDAPRLSRRPPHSEPSSIEQRPMLWQA